MTKINNNSLPATPVTGLEKYQVGSSNNHLANPLEAAKEAGQLKLAELAIRGQIVKGQIALRPGPNPTLPGGGKNFLDYADVKTVNGVTVVTARSPVNKINVTQIGQGDQSLLTLKVNDAVKVFTAKEAKNLRIIVGGMTNTVDLSKDVTFSLTIDLKNADNAVFVDQKVKAPQTIIAGNGNNTIISGAGSDTIKLGNGVNTIYDSGGDNKITTGDGDDTIQLTGSGINTVEAGKGKNRIDALPGNKNIYLNSSGEGTYTFTPYLSILQPYAN